MSRALSELGLERRVEVEVPYFSLVPALLRESDLMATVPTQLAIRLAKDHGLAVLPPPVKLPEFDMCMAWHPRFEREPGLIWLRGLLSTVVGMRKWLHLANLPWSEARERFANGRPSRFGSPIQ